MGQKYFRFLKTNKKTLLDRILDSCFSVTPIQKLCLLVHPFPDSDSVAASVNLFIFAGVHPRQKVIQFSKYYCSESERNLNSLGVTRSRFLTRPRPSPRSRNGFGVGRIGHPPRPILATPFLDLGEGRARPSNLLQPVNPEYEIKFHTAVLLILSPLFDILRIISSRRQKIRIGNNKSPRAKFCEC